jgi:DNA invertase Pin-like site-specific DNA recombinase
VEGELEAAGVGFESLTERIETGSAAGRLVFHVFAALAEFERRLIVERTMQAWTRALWPQRWPPWRASFNGGGD